MSDNVQITAETGRSDDELVLPASIPTHTTSVAATQATFPFSQVQPVDDPAIRSLNSDDSHQISVSGQGIQGDEAAIPPKPQQQQRTISHTPPPWASRATHSRQNDLRG